MKNLSFIILAITIALPIQAQQPDKYEIFKVIGEITYLANNEPVKPGDKVTPIDKLTLANDTKIGILDNTQQQVYYCSGPCTRTVAAIIRDAKRSADNAVASVNAQALSKIHDNASTPKVMGVSYRGDAQESTRLVAICNALRDIANAAPDSLLNLDTVDLDDGSFCFKISNNTDSLLYANIIAIAPGREPKLCINVGMTEHQPFVAVAPYSDVTLSDFIFVDFSPVEYYLFATHEPADSQALSILLSQNQEDDNGHATSIIVAPKISR